MYIKENSLRAKLMGRGTTWLDTGTYESLQEAGSYIKTIEKRQGLKIGSPEETAWRMGFISDSDLRDLGKKSLKSGYGNYLIELVDNK